MYQNQYAYRIVVPKTNFVTKTLLRTNFSMDNNITNYRNVVPYNYLYNSYGTVAPKYFFL